MDPVHHIPGRLRISVPGLRGNADFARAILDEAAQDPGIVEARADPRTGRILLCYRPAGGKGTPPLERMAAAKIWGMVKKADRNLAARVGNCFNPARSRAGVSVARVPMVWRRADGSATLGPPVAAWMDETPLQAAARMGVDPARGLTAEEALLRLERYGENRLPEPRSPSLWRIAVRQMEDFMTVTLAGVAVLSFVLGRAFDGTSILLALAANGAVGVAQERRAGQKFESLRRSCAHAAMTVRDGTAQVVPAAELAPGDVVLLESGDRVPADGLLLQSHGLQIDESSLTGESVPAVKKASETNAGRPLAERSNAAFLGTFVTGGRGRLLVLATGGNTQMGRLAAGLSRDVAERTPLEGRVRVIGRWVVTAVLATVSVVVAVGVARGAPPGTMVLTGVMLAVSAIPEGLPILITIAMAAGMRRLAEKNALVRQLSALETLGRATVICSDKTGTLTQNEMSVQEATDGVTTWIVEGDGYAPSGGVRTVGGPENAGGLFQLARGCGLCNNAQVTLREDGTHQVAGDPMEGALLAFSHRAGVDPDLARAGARRTRESPFESERRRMSVVCEEDGKRELWVKGAVEEVVRRCEFRMDGPSLRRWGEAERAGALERAQEMADRSLRVIAVGWRPEGEDGFAGEGHGVKDEWERKMVFLGLVGMKDPLRARVKESVATCREAGIEVVMITGDHPRTAAAVAREIGLLAAGGETEGDVLTGEDLDGLCGEELLEAVLRTRVYARVSPHHKLAIVKALRGRGHVVAMTGDGVNDAPAVRQADVGIAMGRSGTDVTKEASALTISDDDFTTILRAVEEGRGVLGNIRRALGYLLSGNMGEVLYAAVAVLLGMPVPLAPVQILLVNLLTDAAPTLSLITQGRPARGGQGVLAVEADLTDRRFLLQIVSRAVGISAVSVGVFAIGLRGSGGVSVARTMAFVTLALSQLFQIELWRSDERGLWPIPQSNPHRSVFWATSFALVAVLYLPVIRPFTGVVPLSPASLAVAVGGALAARGTARAVEKALGVTDGREAMTEEREGVKSSAKGGRPLGRIAESLA